MQIELKSLLSKDKILLLVLICEPAVYSDGRGNTGEENRVEFLMEEVNVRCICDSMTMSDDPNYARQERKITMILDECPDGPL